LASSGDADAPCGEPCSHADHCPSSITPAANHLPISRQIRLSAIRCSINFRSHE
jgi:hypothetical protein